MDTNKETPGNRPAAVAGRFYPASARELEEELQTLSREAKPLICPGRSPQAILVPHAGYVFSGEVAASGYNQLSDTAPARIFIIASSHRMRFPGVAVYCSGNYETPLGTVEVDRETGRQLTRLNQLFACREEAHLLEHSLEVQLPFLQARYGKEFRLVPLIVGSQEPAECRQLAQTLQPWFTPDNLFVVSSDFSHYPSYRHAVETDALTTRAILSNDPVLLLKTLKENEKRKIPGLATSLCGWTSVLILLYLTEGKPFRYEWVDYMNSGDQPEYGDRERVVGYSAIALFRKEEEEASLSPGEKQMLLAMAAQSAEYRVKGAGPYLPGKEEATDNLKMKRGAFVSLYVGEELRGCIGSFEGEENLVLTVCRVAASAAADHRFRPLTEEELTRLSVEISVLTPLKRIHSPAEIIPGKHGIYIRKGFSSGTFLPQVAIRYGWSREEFLGRCARDKAGIGWDGWKKAELYTYEAIVFSGKANPASATS